MRPEFRSWSGEELREEFVRVEAQLDFAVFSEEKKMKLNKGDLVEVSSDEEGYRGAWFCASFVEKQGAGFVVEYRDLVSDEDETKQLREKVDSRHIRPNPPEQSTDKYTLYEEVDAYENDGWWVGVVTKVLDNQQYIIYFLQTKEEMVFNHANLRPHLEFIENKWVEASKAMIGTSSPSEVIDADDSVIIPYVSHQNAETGKQITKALSSPMASIDKKLENENSKPVRRSSRQREKQNETTHRDSDSAVRKTNFENLPVVRKLSTPKLTNGKQSDGHQCDGVAAPNAKQVTEPTPGGLLQRNWKEKLRQASASTAISDKGVSTMLLTKHEDSFPGTKTRKQLEARRTANKRGSQLVNVSVKNRKRKTEHGAGATNLGVSEVLIGGEAKHKKRLISSSSLHSSDGINTTTSETHNEVVNPCMAALNMNTDIDIHRDISECSLKTNKESKKNMPYENNTQEGYGLGGAVPSEEKIVTINVPHLEYVGKRLADEDNADCLQGKGPLRVLKLLAYSSVLRTLYYLGDHNWKHEVLLTNLRESLNISNEEHSMELKRITRGGFN